MTDTQEEFTLNGGDLLGKVKDLIQAGKARRLIIKSESGTTLLEIPMNVGVVGAAALTLFAPVIVAVGALAAALTKCTLVVVKKDVSEPIDVTPTDAKDTPSGE